MITFVIVSRGPREELYRTGAAIHGDNSGAVDQEQGRDVIDVVVKHTLAKRIVELLHADPDRALCRPFSAVTIAQTLRGSKLPELMASHAVRRFDG